jgi:8-oxo-dGTP pyrophosphatase MutT (NUDIX family)
MSAVQKPNTASSVILLREAQPLGFEVLLARSPDKASALGRTYGFPGSEVQKSDFADGILSRFRGLRADKARKLLGAHFAPPQALGVWVAAIRALYEEVGILIAVKENGEPITPDIDLNVRLHEDRAALRARSLSFQSILERENLYCDGARLCYFSHWQTPAQFSTRLDTRLFVAATPEGQTAHSTPCDAARSLWLKPDRALQLINRGELPVAFSTFVSLRTLADFGSVQSLLGEFQPKFA